MRRTYYDEPNKQPKTRCDECAHGYRHERDRCVRNDADRFNCPAGMLVGCKKCWSTAADPNSGTHVAADLFCG